MSRTKFFSRVGAVVAAAAIAVGLMVGGCGGDDGEGYAGRTVKIGKLTWMAENLNIATSNSWCYDDKESNCDTYGRLYTWDAAMKACPSGWRLPSRDNWSDLVAGEGYTGAIKLKSTSGWPDKFNGTSGNGTDDYGFTALPGGAYTHSILSSYSGIGRYGEWWTSTEDDIAKNDAYYASMSYDSDDVYYSSYNGRRKDERRSVRCVK